MKLYFFCGLMILCSIVANLLMKIGADAHPDARILGMFSLPTLLGLFIFGCAGLLYAFVLRWVPLNLAQSLLASQYIGVILAAAFILSEPISAQRWSGIILIGLGILLVVRT